MRKIAYNSQREVWMDVPGYNGIYQASTLGNIRSHRKNNGVELLKPSISRGYLQVVLYNKGTSKTRKVHRCIMETFCGISKQECNHINGIRTDNRIDNLEYCTRSENQKHAYKINSEYRNKVRGENNKHSKLTLGDIELIKKLKGVRSQVIVAKYFNVTQACISLIQNNKTWANT